MTDQVPALDRYRIIRDEIAHEDNLIGTRLSWFTASQSFLLTALAIAQGNQHRLPDPGSNYFFPLAPLVGFVSSAMILLGVLAGVAALQRWRRMIELNMAESAPFPRISRDSWIIGFGWSAPIGLPVIFLLMWAYLLWQGFTQ